MTNSINMTLFFLKKKESILHIRSVPCTPCDNLQIVQQWWCTKSLPDDCMTEGFAYGRRVLVCGAVNRMHLCWSFTDSVSSALSVNKGISFIFTAEHASQHISSSKVHCSLALLFLIVFYLQLLVPLLVISSLVISSKPYVGHLNFVKLSRAQLDSHIWTHYWLSNIDCLTLIYREAITAE